MARCQRCGRKGLFFKADENGYCPDCSVVFKLEIEKEQLEKNLSKLKRQVELSAAKYDKLKADYQKLYDDTKKAALDSISKEISTLEKKREELNAENNKIKSDNCSLQTKCRNFKTLFDSYKAANKSYKKTETYDEKAINEMLPTVELELQCMNVKQLRNLFAQNKKSIRDCLSQYEARYTTKSNATIYKLMTFALEAELQNILYGIRYGKLDSSVEAVRSTIAKYTQIAANGNQTILPTVKKFMSEIEVLFIEAVNIEYEYYIQKERIKEEQRAIREKIHQEAAERRALEVEKKRIANEEQKYMNEIAGIREQIKTASAKTIEKLMQKINELENQLDKIGDKREQIATLENGKAGYVYIISNIGSFGNDVFKIGMTRRLDPMERVNELGSASVPFPFDVHGMIFSDDAVGLERELHLKFNDKRLNKVNLRKEYFKISIDEIQHIVEKQFPTAEFHKTALAEQYRQSLDLDHALNQLDMDNFDDEEE